MDVRSFRMLLGWSREELAKRSGVSLASVYLNERMGTARSNDDALITRALLESRKQPPPAPLTGNVAVTSEHAINDTPIVPAVEPRCRDRNENPGR